jgi:hypothetical protein
MQQLARAAITQYHKQLNKQEFVVSWLTLVAEVQNQAVLVPLWLWKYVPCPRLWDFVGNYFIFCGL